ncbi:MAG: M50 family metallopeptidase [Patescibacteria group bacterium]
MTVLIFIIILVLLILVHEFGHLLAAKYFNIRADEFGIGFPPRLATLFWWGETRFTLNAIPFGGFVKIFGEDPDEESIEGPDSDRSFVNKHKAVQVIVLVAGVFFNALLALLLIVIAFVAGIPASEESYDVKYLEDIKPTVVEVVEGSPAEEAGLESGDVLKEVRAGEDLKEIQGAEDLSEFVKDRADEEVTILYSREGAKEEVTLKASEDVVEGEGAKVGVGITSVGIVSFPPHMALVEGVKHTVELTGVIAVELVGFLWSAITGTADYSEVAGPVGIVTLVGDAWIVGFAFLLYFVAVISLHLTIINLMPFPALDGGRVIFVAIEALIRRPINPKVANIVNGIGFIILIILMIAVTVNDISRLFS